MAVRTPADFARPLELTMAIRLRQHVPADTFRAVFREALADTCPTVLAARQAAFTSGVADAFEHGIGELLRNPVALAAAARAAAAGVPVSAVDVGLDAGSVLAKCGRVIHTAT